MTFRKAAFLVQLICLIQIAKMIGNIEVSFQMRKNNCFPEQVVLGKKIAELHSES